MTFVGIRVPWSARSETGTATQHSLVSAASLVAWIHLYLVAMLAGWVAVVALAAGWIPSIVTSGSMSPAIGVGDVVMLDQPTSDLVGQRTVITYRRDGGLVTHRVFEVLVDERAYVTKGDANPTPDPQPVPADAVVGVARLVVPFVGLPLAWYRTGNTVSLVALTVGTLASLLLAARDMATRSTVRPLSSPRTYLLADQAMRRVRILVAVMIATQYVIDPTRFSVAAFALKPFQLLALSLIWLGATNFISERADRRGDSLRGVALGQLVSDTLLVVLLSTSTGNSGIGWVITALPIVEAAVRFRLVGAFFHWVFMALVTIFGQVWVLESTGRPPSEVIANLEQLLDQLSVLLLVVIPGAFLAEQLLGDVVVQRQATDSAVARGRLLESVAEMGSEVTRIGASVFDILARSPADLGFDGAEVWAFDRDRSWRRLGASDRVGSLLIPYPGQAGSGLREEDLIHPDVIADVDDGDRDGEALADAGLESLVRITVASGDTTIVLRAVTEAGRKPDHGRIEAFRLLAGQARVALHNRDLVSELQDLHSEMEFQALHDALTGLPNRAYFLRELNGQLAESVDDGRSGRAVLFLDLNGFKPVNDTLGHEAGDELLKVVAARLAETIGERGTAARLGGDEFTVLLNDAPDTTTSTEVAHQVHVAIGRPIRLDQDTVTVGASIGVAHLEPGIDGGEWLRRADLAMYAAKAAGGAEGAPRIAYYDPILEQVDGGGGRVANEFRRALVTEGLTLVYQPIVSTVDGSLRGCEALLRWNHPEMGPLGPQAALEMAQKTNTVADLTSWIFNTALADVARWAVPAEADFTIALNVSPAELEQPELDEILGDALLLSGIEPNRVMVELSERLVAGGAPIDAMVNRLLRLGVGLSLDDFGEGKTSLGHLRSLPVRQLKLDRLLVQQANASEHDRVIFEAIVDLGHRLQFEVVVEGVETVDHLAICRQVGAELVQGFGLWRPLPADQLAELIGTSNRLGIPRPQRPEPQPAVGHARPFEGAP